MDQRIGSAERQNSERHRSARQSLNHIVNRAVAPAGKHRIAACRDRASRVIRRFLAGAANGELSMNSRRLDDANRMVQLRVAAAAPGIGIEEDCRFAHSFVVLL